jgi:hypothetical protein
MPVIEGKYYDTDDTSWWDDLIDKLSPKQPPPPAAPTPPGPLSGGHARNTAIQADTSPGLRQKQPRFSAKSTE